MKSRRSPSGNRHRGGPSQRLKSRARGFTLIEVIVIVVILGVLAAVIAPRFLSRIGQSKRSVAESNAASLAQAVRLFIADHGNPESGAGIEILWEKPANVEDAKWQPYVENADKLLDPWGNPYSLYTFANNYSGTAGGAVLLCRGPNGAVNTSAANIFAGTPSGDDILQVVTYSP